MVVTTEAPLSEPAENRDQVEPTLSEQPAPSQERKWSAPHMEWDATKYAPPQESRPEAVNFPSQTYEFSDSRDLFQAPQSYPEPPKDMWYEVPAEKPKVTEQPKAIFPWEGRERPVATRVFASDFIPPPVTLLSQQDPAQVQQTSSVQADQAREATPSPPPAASWEDFSQRPNAWDTVPGIDTYVRGVISQQTKKGRPQSISLAGATEAISSPTLTHGERRQSLLVTDFPTAVERPSLPVTPAPIRRPSFWGEDKDAAGTALPAAEGVPNQAEWVCPKCGFSSDSASPFLDHRPRPSSSSSHASTLAAVGLGQDLSVSPASVPSPATPEQHVIASSTDDRDVPPALASPQNSAAPSVTSSSTVAPVTSPSLVSQKIEISPKAEPEPEPQLVPSAPPKPLSLHPPPAYHFNTLPLHLRPIPPKRKNIQDDAAMMTSPSLPSV